jgi:hypothetical protein
LVVAIVGVGWLAVVSTGRTDSPAPGTASRELELVPLYNEITEPCPPGRQAYDINKSPATAEGRQLVDQYGPDEDTVVRRALAGIHTPSHDTAAVLAELKKVKIAVIWTWNAIRTDADDISVNPAYTTAMTRKMQRDRGEFNAAFERYTDALLSGRLPFYDDQPRQQIRL